MPIPILTADDDPMVRAYVRQILEGHEEVEVVAEASDWPGVLEAVGESSAEVALLDLFMPGGDGVEMIQRLRALHPEVQVVVLTGSPDTAQVRRTLRAGAAGFLTKDIEAAEILAAIQAVSRGRSYIGVPLQDDVLQDVVRPSTPMQALVETSRADPEALAQVDLLSDRERETLVALAHGFTNKEIARDLQVSVKTVETYRARLQDKLGLRGRAEVVQLALRAGLLGP